MQDIRTTLTYLYDLQFFGIKFGLENTRALLQLVGNPHKKFPVIHVAGTNGKGSVCAMLASIFEAAGLRCGLYTSPHIVHFSERIRINNIEISENDIVRLTRLLQPEIDRLQCTFFEATTVMAFQYFAEQHVDIAVIETGLGGRLDATNVVEPEVSVITTIDFDHMAYLGDTLEKIASEKAGIIKPDKPVIVGNIPPEAFSVMQNKAHENRSPLYALGTHITIQNSEVGIDGGCMDAQWRFSDSQGTITKINIPLIGEHQLDNAALAVAAARLQTRFSVSDDDIRKGIRAVIWKGRCFIKRKRPWVIVDAAHNPAGMRSLARSIALLHKEITGQKILMIGMLSDKDSRNALHEIVPLFDRVVAVTPPNPRALPADALAALIHQTGKPVAVIPDTVSAYDTTLQKLKADDLLVVTGSFYVLQDILLR